MKIVSIMWSSYANMLVRAARNVADILEVSAYSSRTLEEDPERLDAALKEAADADIIFLYRSSEGFWEVIKRKLKELGKDIPIVCCGYDPSYWTLSTVGPETVAKCNSYVVINGEENLPTCSATLPARSAVWTWNGKNQGLSPGRACIIQRHR